MNARIIIVLLPVAAFITILIAQNQPAQVFTPPDSSTRLHAIGNLQFLPEDQRNLFTPTRSFFSKTPPRAGDWLASHRERGQTFNQFLQTRRNLFVPPRQKLYIQPIGEFDDQEKLLLPKLEEYLKIFFQAEVVIQKSIDTEDSGITIRKNPHTEQTQLLTTDILNLLKKDLPEDAYARIAVSVTDLYPADDWNFVFGQATYRERVGVFSFARHGAIDTTQFFRRSIKVTAHEMGHMFGIMHCIYFQCLMNGSNNLSESDRTPLTLCPVCLRKLHSTNSFEIEPRYRQMKQFLTKHKLFKEAQWLEKRIAELQ